MTIHGADLSHYQGTPDFVAVRTALDFVFSKATEGATYADAAFAHNRDAAAAAGLVFGAYHFARGGDAAAEAQHFCDALGGALRPGELVALDWEIAYSGDAVGWCLSWLQSVKAKLGVAPLVYLNGSTVGGKNWDRVAKGGYGLWLAQYDFSDAAPTTTGAFPFAAIKQYSDKGAVPGIAGGVDLDAFYGDRAALLRYGCQAAPVPAPAPAPKPAPAPTPKPAPAPGFDVRAWRVSAGQNDAHLPSLRRWANAMFPAYACTPLDATGVTTYGPQTIAFVREFGNHVGIPNDGRDIGPRLAGKLADLGWRG